MKKGSKVVHWSPADDALIKKMRGAGATWEEVAAAVSTKKAKRSAEATMQRMRYITGKQKRKPTKVRVMPPVKTSGAKTSRFSSKKPNVAALPAPERVPAAPQESITVGGQTFSLPRL